MVSPQPNSVVTLIRRPPAPRQTLVRIATGRDAADIAFLDIRNGAIGNSRPALLAATSEPAHG